MQKTKNPKLITIFAAAVLVPAAVYLTARPEMKALDEKLHSLQMQITKNFLESDEKYVEINRILHKNLELAAELQFSRKVETILEQIQANADKRVSNCEGFAIIMKQDKKCHQLRDFSTLEM